MPKSFFTFTEEARRAYDDEAGKPWPHLALKVRFNPCNGGYRIRGDHDVLIGRLHRRARDAVDAIQQYCQAQRFTAAAEVYWQDGRLYLTVEVFKDGTRRVHPAAAMLATRASGHTLPKN